MGSRRGSRFLRYWAAICRWRGVNNPIDTALVEGLCHITPSQDHTPSLACEVVMEGLGTLLTRKGPFHLGGSLLVRSGGVVIMKMRLPSWCGLAGAGGCGVVIC